MINKIIKISYLIPVYNGEKYLDRLIASIVSQNISPSEYEIVFADDCSRDCTVEIIEQYQKTYPNIRLLRNENNVRTATNINSLISAAQGQYVWIIGQDDYIEPSSTGKLYARLEKDNLDVLVFNYRRVYENELTQAECKVVTDTAKQSGVEWIKNQFDNRDYCQYILGYEWRAIYRNEYLREKHVKCINGMLYEDTVFMLKALVRSNAVASIEDILYNYRINESSITYGVNHVKRGDLIYEFAFVVGQEVEDFYNELKMIDNTLAANLNAHLLKRYNNFAFDLIRTPNEHKKVFYQILQENHDFVLTKQKYLNWKSKLLINNTFGYPVSCLCFLGYRLLKFIKH